MKYRIHLDRVCLIAALILLCTVFDNQLNSAETACDGNPALLSMGSILSGNSHVRSPAPDDSPSSPFPHDQYPVESWNVWWHPKVVEPTRENVTSLPMTLESLLVRCVAHSHQIKVFSDLPLIRRTAITEADAAFDATSFINSRWDDTVDPVGSTLTGAVGRYRNQQLSNSIGMRKRTLSGGVLEGSQQFGVQETNSTFFTPNPQGTSKLKLSYTHPLLRGNGRRYNSTLTCLAIFDTRVATFEFSRQIQSHLTEVTRAYWGLYVARSSLLIRQKSLGNSQQLLSNLEERADIDAVKPQVMRAIAEVAVQESAVNRAQMTVRTMEAKIRSLVNDPALGTYETVELVPNDTPFREAPSIDMQESLQAALCNRPEVHQSLIQIQAASLRLNASKREMLPILNVVTESYLAGLEEDSDVGSAWVEQFSDGRPSYAVGSQFEVPIGFRAASAQRDRRIVELRQLKNQYKTTLHSLDLEVGAAVREIEATWSEFEARQLSMEAQLSQVQSTIERWRLLPGDNGNGALVMESMLRDYDRLTRSEIALVESLISYNVALFSMHKATGDLLMDEQVSWVDYVRECGLPAERFVSKPDLGLLGDPQRTDKSTCDSIR